PTALLARHQRRPTFPNRRGEIRQEAGVAHGADAGGACAGTGADRLGGRLAILDSRLWADALPAHDLLALDLHAARVAVDLDAVGEAGGRGGRGGDIPKRAA